MGDTKLGSCLVGGVRWMGWWREIFGEGGRVWYVVIEMCVCCDVVGAVLWVYLVDGFGVVGVCLSNMCDRDCVEGTYMLWCVCVSFRAFREGMVG